MPAPFTLTAEAEGPSAVQLLWKYWHVCEEEGHPLQDHLFRPVSRDGRGFAETSGTCSAFNKRLKAIFSSAGVPYSPTPHGGRRGAAQEREARGATDGDLAKVLGLYLDKARHKGGVLKRLKRNV